MIKAEALLSVISNITPGKYVTWPVYDGKDILEAKTVEDYVTTFFRTGEVMPIPVLNLGLNIHSVEIDYNDELSTHKVTIEGFVIKPRV